MNSKHEKVALRKGEIGIPVLLKEMYGIKIGDLVTLSHKDVEKSFVVKEFIVDSQMNSPMVSSTRILLSDEDFKELSGQIGENEYLIEVYFTDPKEASNFQTLYENEGLPQNGQAVTYTIIFMLSALTDMVTVFVLLLVSVLLAMVSLICIQFIIIAALEEEIGEIATMKAIGLNFASIRDLYLNKYRVLAMFGVVVGYILAFLMSNIVTKHISDTFGEMKRSPLVFLISFMAGCLVFVLINYYCQKILKKIKKLTVVDALVSGKGFEKSKGAMKDRLYKSKKLTVNWLLGTREIFYRFKNWIIVFAIALIAVLMILIPVNLMNTFEAPEFITYMGSALEDILIEVENGENLEVGYENVKKVLENDNAIETYNEYKRVRVQTVNSEGEISNLHVDSGENSGNELQYLTGRAPEGEREIAISYLESSEMGKGVGDTLMLLVDNKEQKFVVSGVYQDVTSGGYTAKSKYDFSGIKAEKYSFSVNLWDNMEVHKKADVWSKTLGAGISVDPMEEFIDQTLGGVVKQLRRIVFATVIIGAGLVVLITVLFLKLRLVKDLSEIAILKAIGFPEQDIKKQYLIKIGCISIAGILVGILMTDALGGKIVSTFLSITGLGIKKIELISNPIIGYVVCPLFLLTLILLVTWITLKTIKKYHMIAIINE